jgi:riboflavin kinase / FMN adenylyltransferase
VKHITGKVIHGDHYGKVLGFPTANLDRRQFARSKMKIKLGVWAGRGEIVASSKNQAARKYKAAIVIGPLDKYHLPKIEAHLIDFKGNLYGKRITIFLGKFIREWKNIKNISMLKIRIKKDVEIIKRMR